MIAAALVAGEWLRRPGPVWVGLAWAACGISIVALLPLREWRRRALAAALLGLALALTIAQVALGAIESRWPAEREARVAVASRRLAGDLHSAYHEAERIAGAAADISVDDRAAAFVALSRLVPTDGPETGVTLLGRDGAPWAWAGRHRLPPVASGDSIGVRASGYYVLLEARRHSDDGRTAVATLLIWAHPAVPDRERSLTELFRDRTEVGLRVYPPGSAPDGPDIYDYQEPTTAGPRLLFSVQPVPPEQGAAKELAYERGSRAVTWMVLLALALALSVAARPIEWCLVLPLSLWLPLRAPIGRATGLEPLFSPATFFRPLLGPVTSSAGTLALAGTLLTVLGVWLWRRRLPRTRPGVALGIALLVLSPYLISGLGRGITPPSTGVSVGLWLTWQLTLLVSASALIVVTAALFRGARVGPAERIPWRAVAGVAIAVAASVVGVLVWIPRGGWPDWYTFLWTPALLLVTLPAPRWATVLGIALVAGSSAALVTWSAELAGKLQVARRDMARLGTASDPFGVPLLEGFAERARRQPAPEGASELYAVWHGSPIGAQGYPAHLALWDSGGSLLEELPLDSLDLPVSLLGSLVRGLPAGREQRIVPLVRVPGVHYVLVARLRSGHLLTAAIGPRTALIPPGRIGRLLEPARRRTTLYRLTLSPPSAKPVEIERPRWRREGWTLRSERSLHLPGGVRTVYALVDMRGPVPLLVRGALVVALDACVLGLLWLLAEFVAGGRLPRPRWRSLARSYRIRLAATLAAFFIVPAVGFAAWSFARLSTEVQRSRDVLIAQTLRDAVLAGGRSLRAGGEPGRTTDERLRELSHRIDADLALYVGGELAGTSTPVLEHLGVTPRLMEPGAFVELALGGELELTRGGTTGARAERIGYRVAEPGPPGTIAILATPQLADDPSLADRQLDLALVLLLATIIGVAAALSGAQAASRALSRPVSELRRSALALGRGQPLPPHREQPPLEFEPVFGAFERMAADIRSTQAALEAARRRTAAVLATVGTGVVALDPAGRVLIANPQAVELLGAELEAGGPFLERLGPDWAALAALVRGFLDDSAADDSAAPSDAELEVGGRRLTAHLASLGPDVRGVVMALNDVTDLSRAERVLAWGEMARQVAHEIKNPLTPMRLGMQHLRRVYRDRRPEFEAALEETSARILAEIDRLDTIARAFSRFAAPADDHQPLDRVDLTAVVGEVVQLYRLAAEGCTVEIEALPSSPGAARADEVKEVVVNLLENARHAGAKVVTVRVAPGLLRVADDGQGIAPELLPRIFEPRFSTTTSGSGLGLAIVRRLVEGWGGRIGVESEPDRGTVVSVWLPV